MKVKVIKSAHDDLWYKGEVGKVFTVECILASPGWYRLLGEHGHGARLLMVDDTEVQDEQPEFPFRVRCIDDERAEYALKRGEIYVATGEYLEKDYVLEGINASWHKCRFEVVEEDATQDEEQPSEEYTGSSVSYYKVEVSKPTNPDSAPYVAECNDIIEALNMNYAEGNAFKAIWRSCAARALGVAKKGYDDGLYDAEKVVFFGTRMVEMAKNDF
jgi:hypothetical protein